MSFMVEGVLNRAVHAEEAMARSSRFEPLHFVLSPSHRLMRVFGPCFGAAVANAGRLVADGGAQA
jgi:hypothetical protein